MDRQIRLLGIFLLLCFLVLFGQLNNVQVLQQKRLANAGGNPRVFLLRMSKPRGVIQTADGVVVAQSIPSHDKLKYQRIYPKGPLYSGITGFDSLIYGATGLEYTYNSQLSAHSAPIHSLSDLLTPRVTTDTLTLTVSNALQSLAAQELGSKHGAVVVMNPSTGAVLAMYGSPSFDPNALASHDTHLETASWKADLKSPVQPLLDRAYATRYPPGSTFKIITSAAIWDQAPSLATKTWPLLPALPLPQTTHKLHNYANEVCGGTLTEAFKVSCDTTYGQIGLDLGASKLSNEATAFGFNTPPPLPLGSVASSVFPPPSSFAQNLPGLAYAAIGQGSVDASALQMAMVASAIADGGRMMSPQLISQIRDTQGNVVSTMQPKLWRQATSSATAAYVSTLMQGVTQPGGTAANVALPGMTVAAKTGTAQIGLGNHRTDDWLVAFAPAANPRVAVAVVVTNQLNSTGSSAAGPIARAMLQAALGSLRG